MIALTTPPTTPAERQLLAALRTTAARNHRLTAALADATGRLTAAENTLAGISTAARNRGVPARHVATVRRAIDAMREAAHLPAPPVPEPAALPAIPLPVFV